MSTSISTATLIARFQFSTAVRRSSIALEIAGADNPFGGRTGTNIADFAFEAVRILAFAGTAGTIASRVDPGFMLVLENCEIDADDFFAGLREAEQLGITRQLPPGQIHSLEHLMLPALARVGLLTQRVRARYEEAGIPISEDPRILHAMEGGHPVAA